MSEKITKFQGFILLCALCVCCKRQDFRFSWWWRIKSSSSGLWHNIVMW